MHPILLKVAFNAFGSCRWRNELRSNCAVQLSIQQKRCGGIIAQLCFIA